MCFHHDHFHFMDLFSSVVIPSAAIYITIENSIYHRRKDNRELNQLVYREKFKYTFQQLFNNAFVTDTGIFNIPFIHKLNANIILFEKENKFYGYRVRKKFNKVCKIVKEINMKSEGAKYFDGEVEFYQNLNNELKQLRKAFLKFYSLIFGAI